MTSRDAATVGRAEAALYRRLEVACAAARSAGVAGRFRAFAHGGLYAVMASDPALGFLCTISGVTGGLTSAAVELLAAWNEPGPTVLAAADLDAAAEAQLCAAGMVRAAPRLLALRPLDRAAASPAAPPDPDLLDAVDSESFVPVLLAGYQAEGVVAAFIGAEHRDPTVRRCLLVDGATPVAAGAMTVHGDVAVLGGASTLPSHRGQGAQTRLLRHRLRTAADAGCTLAVATALPGSVSAANLERAGFQLHPRAAWTPG